MTTGQSERNWAREVDVLIVGAGPAGLAAAWAVRAAGAERVLVVERASELGGLARHCEVGVFGVRDLGLAVNGPAYARIRVERAVAAGAELLTGTSVTSWQSPPGSGTALALEAEAAGDPGVVHARAVVLATGAREMPQSAAWLGGAVPEGVVTVSQVLELAHRGDLEAGGRAVIVGSDTASYLALQALSRAGIRTRALVSSGAAPEAHRGLQALAELAFAVPVLSHTRLEGVDGDPLVRAIRVRHADGRTARIACDLVVVSGSWQPEGLLAASGALAIDPGTGGPEVDVRFRTSQAGVFAAGNLVHPVLSADRAASAATALATAVLDHVRRPKPRVVGVSLVVQGDLQWVFPQRIVPGGPQPPRAEFVLWPSRDREAARITVRQGDRVLHALGAHRLRARHPVVIPARWVDEVDPLGPAVVVRTD